MEVTNKTQLYRLIYHS